MNKEITSVGMAMAGWGIIPTPDDVPTAYVSGIILTIIGAGIIIYGVTRK